MVPTYRILYVDDEPALLEIGKIFLERSGQFVVDIITSAPDALTLLSTKNYDAIISDYQMPEMDGIEFLKKVRTSGNTIPFILFTGRGREEVVIQSLNAGADFYLQKGGEPVSQFTELAHQIRQAVQQKRAEASIRDHERREADIINFLPDATFAIDRSGNIIAWNRAIEEMTGISAAGMLGKGDYEYAIPFYGQRQPILIDLIFEPDDVIAKRYAHIIHKKDTLIADTTLPLLKGRPATLMVMAGPLYNRQGEVVGAIESIRDITERKLAEEALRESEERFRDLSDLLPQIVYESDMDGNLTYANRIAFERFGYTEDEFRQGFNFLQMIAPRDRQRAAASFRAILEGRGLTGPADEYQALRKDGGTFPISIYSSLIVVNGRTTGLRGIIVDITERKRADEEIRSANEQLSASAEELRSQYDELAESEKRIRESEERYRNVVEDQTEFISRFLPDGTHVFVNEAYCRYFGLTRDEILGHRFRPKIPAGDRERVKQFFTSLTHDHPVNTIEHRIIMPDGSTRWQRWSDRAIFDPSGTVTEYQSVGRDTTERKQEEQALHENEQRLDSIYNTVGDVIFQLTVEPDEQYRFASVNAAFSRITGLPPGQVIGRKVNEIIPEPSLSLVREKYRQAIVEKAIVRWEETTDYPTGQLTGEVSIAPIFDSAGTCTHLIGSVHDITERKRAEEILKKSELNYRGVIENLQDVFYRVDSAGTITMASPSVADVFGYCSVDEVIGLNLTHDFYKDPAKRLEFLDEIKKTGSVKNFEAVLKKKDGTPVIVSTSAHYYRDPDGNVLGVEGIVKDITEQKQAEEALRESEQQFHALTESSKAAITLYRQKLIYTNPATERLTGYRREEMAGMDFWELAHPDERQDIHNRVLARLQGEPVPTQYEFRILRKDGETRWVEVSATTFTYHGATASLSVLIDITDRKRAEEALRASEEKYRHILENLQDGYFRMDRDHHITMVSPSAARMYGYGSPEEMIGIPAVSLLRDPGQRDEMHKKLQENGRINDFTGEVRHKDGSLFWVSISIQFLQDREGHMIGTEAIVRDISGRKAMEHAIHEANRKLNLLNTITRHDVTNQLTALQGYVQLAYMKKPDPTITDFLHKIQEAAETIDRQIAFTRVYQELGIQAPSWFALDEVAAKASGTAMPVRFSGTCRTVRVLADPMLERVFFNLFENAVRHGKRVTGIVVRCEREPDGLLVIIEDDGVGIKPHEKEKIFTKGYGKNTGFGLFLAKEILAITGITIRETGSFGKGARFEMLVPKGAFRLPEAKERKR